MVRVKIIASVVPPLVAPSFDTLQVEIETFLTTVADKDVLSVTVGVYPQYGSVTTLVGTIVYEED